MDKLEKQRVQVIKKAYPEGTRVVLVRMEDEQAVPKGTEGTVVCVDDIGTVHVSWDNGSTLGVVIGEDVVQRVGENCPKTSDVNSFTI